MELFPRENTGVNEHTDTSATFPSLMNALSRPALFSVEMLHNTSDLVISTVHKHQILKNGKNRKFLNPIVRQSVESLEEEKRRQVQRDAS